METKSPLAFLSYSHSDDKSADGTVRRWGSLLSDAVQTNSGEKFPIFVDRDAILWGQPWESRIKESLDSTFFLIPIVTPSYFKSKYCRKEFLHFLERERDLKRTDLILPIYFVTAPVLDDRSKREKDEIAMDIHRRGPYDCRDLRLMSEKSKALLKRLDKMSRDIIAALERSALKIAGEPPAESSPPGIASRRAGNSETSLSSLLPRVNSADGDVSPSQSPIQSDLNGPHKNRFARIKFNCSAVASSGRIHKPEDLFLQSSAVSYVPPSGGFSETSLTLPHEVDRFGYRDVIAFTRAHSRALADHRPSPLVNEGAGRGSTESRIENLRINVDHPNLPQRNFSARSLGVRLTGIADSNAVFSRSELSVTFEGLQLWTGTEHAELTVGMRSDIFVDLPTRESLKNVYENDHDFRKQFGSLFLLPGRKGLLGLFARNESPFKGGGTVDATFVRRLQWDGGRVPVGAEILGNRLTIDGFGRIYFGEIEIGESSTRITLLRVELDSVIEGEASFCGVHLKMSSSRGQVYE